MYGAGKFARNTRRSDTARLPLKRWWRPKDREGVVTLKRQAGGNNILKTEEMP